LKVRVGNCLQLRPCDALGTQEKRKHTLDAPAPIDERHDDACRAARSVPLARESNLPHGSTQQTGRLGRRRECDQGVERIPWVEQQAATAEPVSAERWSDRLTKIEAEPLTVVGELLQELSVVDTREQVRPPRTAGREEDRPHIRGPHHVHETSSRAFDAAGVVTIKRQNVTRHIDEEGSAGDSLGDLDRLKHRTTSVDIAVLGAVNNGLSVAREQSAERSDEVDIAGRSGGWLRGAAKLHRRPVGPHAWALMARLD
jgi:hypothetical protein